MKVLALLATLLITSSSTAQNARETNIKNYIYSVTKKEAYAQRLAKQIIKVSQEEKLDPYLITSVAKIESDFSMNSKPCIGIMQVELKTYKELDRSTGLNPRNWKDNIKLGARELHRYFYHKKLASRNYDFKLRYTLGRYNGCGSRGKYVNKVIRVYKQLKTKGDRKCPPQKKYMSTIKNSKKNTGQ